MNPKSNVLAKSWVVLLLALDTYLSCDRYSGCLVNAVIYRFALKIYEVSYFKKYI